MAFLAPARQAGQPPVQVHQADCRRVELPRKVEISKVKPHLSRPRHPVCSLRSPYAFLPFYFRVGDIILARLPLIADPPAHHARSFPNPPPPRSFLPLLFSVSTHARYSSPRSIVAAFLVRRPASLSSRHPLADEPDLPAGHASLLNSLELPSCPPSAGGKLLLMAYLHDHRYSFPTEQQQHMLHYPHIPYPYYPPQAQHLEHYYPAYRQAEFADFGYHGFTPDEFDDGAEASTRPRLTKEQVDVLENQFQAHPKPNSLIKRQLAMQTKLTLPRVAVSRGLDSHLRT